MSYLYSPLAKRSEGMIYRYGTLRQITYYFHHSLKLLLAAKLSVCLLDSDLKFRKVKHTQTGPKTQDPTRLPIMIYSQEIKVIFFRISSGKNTNPKIKVHQSALRFWAPGRREENRSNIWQSISPIANLLLRIVLYNRFRFREAFIRPFKNKNISVTDLF